MHNTYERHFYFSGMNDYSTVSFLIPDWATPENPPNLIYIRAYLFQSGVSVDTEQLGKNSKTCFVAFSDVGKEEVNNGDANSSHLREPIHSRSWIYTTQHTHTSLQKSHSHTRFTSRPKPKRPCRFVMENKVNRTLACFEAVIAFLSWSGRATLTICIFKSSKHKKERSLATVSLRAKQTKTYRNGTLNTYLAGEIP